MYRRMSVHSSFCSRSSAPMNLMMAASFGRVPTTLVRRLISLWSRARGWVAWICVQGSFLKAIYDSTSSFLVSISSGTEANRSRRLSATLRHCLRASHCELSGRLMPKRRCGAVGRSASDQCGIRLVGFFGITVRQSIRASSSSGLQKEWILT
jgi:hypothetical protein